MAVFTEPVPVPVPMAVAAVTPRLTVVAVTVPAPVSVMAWPPVASRLTVVAALMPAAPILRLPPDLEIVVVAPALLPLNVVLATDESVIRTLPEVLLLKLTVGAPVSIAPALPIPVAALKARLPVVVSVPAVSTMAAPVVNVRFFPTILAFPTTEIPPVLVPAPTVMVPVLVMVLSSESVRPKVPTPLAAVEPTWIAVVVVVGASVMLPLPEEIAPPKAMLSAVMAIALLVLEIVPPALCVNNVLAPVTLAVTPPVPVTLSRVIAPLEVADTVLPEMVPRVWLSVGLVRPSLAVRLTAPVAVMSAPTATLPVALTVKEPRWVVPPMAAPIVTP